MSIFLLLEWGCHPYAMKLQANKNSNWISVTSSLFSVQRAHGFATLLNLEEMLLSLVIAKYVGLVVLNPD